jgi:hypothetical protein
VKVDIGGEDCSVTKTKATVRIFLAWVLLDDDPPHPLSCKVFGRQMFIPKVSCKCNEKAFLINIYENTYLSINSYPRACLDGIPLRVGNDYSIFTICIYIIRYSQLHIPLNKSILAITTQQPTTFGRNV